MRRPWPIRASRAHGSRECHSTKRWRRHAGSGHLAHGVFRRPPPASSIAGRRAGQRSRGVALVVAHCPWRGWSRRELSPRLRTIGQRRPPTGGHCWRGGTAYPARRRLGAVAWGSGAHARLQPRRASTAHVPRSNDAAHHRRRQLGHPGNITRARAAQYRHLPDAPPLSAATHRYAALRPSQRGLQGPAVQTLRRSQFQHGGQRRRNIRGAGRREVPSRRDAGASKQHRHPLVVGCALIM